MNKYQEALDTIGARGVNDYGEETMKTVFAEEFFCLQELIDKETPKKVEILEDFDDCPNCGRRLEFKNE